ncbi:hypothetical protein [Flavilitoribacter nigricans]|uniref:Uncharacterized protein n=1 Tax=Flavilitoribacter nigricans (strain ATCC 23147 / DSM 23189 / NBRC 102662 / NCIMB 1420 / SS-2) TaxID=1122177 RepID=A0A2D0NEN9_FLAN2|nr:hypothetical protein [Flavilitoribacter nigricans]PHN06962.1 hypothetical protein CRP01_09100 [Flavilitoribacter nigricans DSM 23189 = NBRC 102662]
MPKDIEQLRAKNLANATKTVTYWEKESERNQKYLAQLKAEIEEEFERGKVIANHLAAAKEYLQDLEQEPNL